MNILNTCPFTFAYVPGRIPFPGHSLTLVVKGTFDLVPHQKASVAEEQPFPTGDEFYEDDEEMLGGPRYSSDFAYFKPKTDLLLVGKCEGPKGEKVLAQQCTFRVGSHRKHLMVTGNRYWRRGLLGSASSDPAPFDQIDLRYENSYGGEGYLKNPVGKGYRKQRIDSGKKRRLLPNILNLDDKLDSPRAQLEPAGFGPLGINWQQRQSKLGTYKGKYLKERWPWFAADFDWAYFNAAPSDMQVDGYLKGDEELSFENLHREYPQFKASLPGLRIYCFVNKQDDPSPALARLEKVEMNLDTLYADMEASKLVLVWRGWTEVDSEEFEEIKHIFIVSEPLDAPERPIDYYNDLFLAQLTQEEETEEEPEVLEEEPDDDADIEKEIAEAEKQTQAALIEAGLDPKNPPTPSPEQKAEEAKILKELGFEEEPEPVEMTRALFQERAATGESFEGEDLSNLDLSALDLSKAQLQGAILTGANLTKTDLSGNDLTAAILAGADLSGAVLKKSCLKEVDLTGARLVSADLTQAVLDDALCEKAVLREAILNKISGKNTDFSEADLASASLRESDFSGADFSKCRLENADFTSARLCDASVEGAQAASTDFSKADLTKLRASEGADFSECIFSEALGPESIWEGANLTKADLSYSRMEGANFTSACLVQANLSAADMKAARFTKADLKNAQLVQMNLFEGSLKKADLTGTDLRGSNLYGVEFLDAHFEETNLEHANVKMTKLVKN